MMLMAKAVTFDNPSPKITRSCNLQPFALLFITIQPDSDSAKTVLFNKSQSQLSIIKMSSLPIMDCRQFCAHEEYRVGLSEQISFEYVKT